MEARDCRSSLTKLALVAYLAISMVFAGPAMAAETEDEDDGGFVDMSLEELLDVQIEVSSAQAETVFNTPSTVSVIDRRTIEQYGFRYVSEAIETLAGVSVLRTYLKRQIPTIRGLLQDHYANKVLVLIDGTPAWNAVTGEGSIDRISIDDIERIEVLKGPASVLYGTNAYAGAINLVLRKPEHRKADGHGGRVAGRIGGFKYLTGGGAYTYQGDGLSLLVAANAMDERGKSYGFIGERDVYGVFEEYLRGASFTFRGAYDASWGTHTLLFNGFRTEESYLGVVPRWASGTGKGHEINGYLGSYTFTTTFADMVDLKLGGLFDWQHRNLGRTADDSVRANITGYRGGFSLGAVVRATDWLHLELGGAYDYRKSIEYANYETLTREVVAANEMDDRTVYEFSLYGQAKLMLAPLIESVPITLLGGVRWTNNQLFDSDLSIRGTLVYNVFEGSSIKVVAGQSFRAPTLFELYFETPSQTVFGNTDLNPEKSTSVELAYLIGKGNFFAQVLGYYGIYDNKIFRVRRNPNDPDDTSLMYVNGGDFSAWGVEAELKYQDPKIIDAFLTYTYTHGDNGDELDDNDHYNFKYIPAHAFSLGIGKRFYGFSVSTVLNYVGSRGAPIQNLDDQMTWDLNLGYAGEMFQHQLSVKNILNEDVLVPAYVRRNLNAYNTGFGRTIFYTLRASF